MILQVIASLFIFMIVLFIMLYYNIIAFQLYELLEGKLVWESDLPETTYWTSY